MEERGPERRSGYCPQHPHNTKSLEELVKQVNKEILPKQGVHDGMWKIVMLVLMTAIGGLYWVNDLQATRFSEQQEKMLTHLDATKTAAQETNKVVMVYIASHTAEALEGFRRIGENEQATTTNAKAIQSLDRGVTNNSKDIITLRRDIDAIKRVK